MLPHDSAPWCKSIGYEIVMEIHHQVQGLSGIPEELCKKAKLQCHENYPENDTDRKH